MRRTGRIFLIALLVAAGAAMWAFAWNTGWWPSQNGETSLATAVPGVADEDTREGKAANAEQTARPADAAPDAAAGNAKPEPDKPAFDIVRVEDSGEMVVAGVAPPGWTVRINTPQRLIGSVKAGFDGSWVLLPGSPLPPGDHSLSVTAIAPDGSRTVAGAERVAISVSPDSAPAVVALSQDNRPTRILQTGQTDDGDDQGVAPGDTQSVAFAAVDYEDKQQTGQLYLSGEAEPRARVALYLDNRFIGSARAGENGTWEFKLTDILGSGEHLLRADHVDLESGDVLSRAEVRFAPESVAVASADGGETRSARVGSTRSLAQEQRLSKPIGDAAATRPESPGVDPVDTGKPREQAIVVKRGDTLWHIAEEHYGAGVRYTKIFRDNRDQIRNPHRIYPGQNFTLPR